MDSLLVITLVLAAALPVNGLVYWLIVRAFLRNMGVTGQPYEAVMSNIKFQQEETAKNNAVRRPKPITPERALS